MIKKIFATLLIFVSLFAKAQTVTEIITIDTSTISIPVIYKPDTKGYYFKKIAVFANDTSKIAIEKTFTKYGQNGIYKAYYPSGQLMVLTVYANSKIHGDFTYYGPDGIIKVKGKYKFGVKHKFWAYKEDKSYGRYKQGLKNGRWTHTDNNGEKHIAHFQNGNFKYGEKRFFKNFFSKKNGKKGSTSTKQNIKTTPINNEYQQVVEHLTSNYLFRKKFKYFYASKKKERAALDKHFDYKKDVFKFRLAPITPAINLNIFTKELNEQKITNTTIANILTTDTIGINLNKTPESNNNISKTDHFIEYSTDKNAAIIVYLSKLENNMIIADIFNCAAINEEMDYAQFYNNNSCKKMSILYYFDNEGEMSLEYQDAFTP